LNDMASPSYFAPSNPKPDCTVTRFITLCTEPVERLKV
jgi:hypothetical protein